MDKATVRNDRDSEVFVEHRHFSPDLYSFARMVMWLPQYQDSDLETIVADPKDIFSRWPWYDEQVTDYQIRYEFSNTIGGDTPLPMNCDNDDLQRYCIGQEQCPYSIWGSLPFPDEMYDQLDGAESTGDEFQLCWEPTLSTIPNADPSLEAPMAL